MSAAELRDNERAELYAPDRRMDAYYYSFDPTGVPEIDAILSAVAHAGKGSHGTEGWTDSDQYSRWGEGRSCIDVIQAAAYAARDHLAAVIAERDELVRRARLASFVPIGSDFGIRQCPNPGCGVQTFSAERCPSCGGDPQ